MKNAASVLAMATIVVLLVTGCSKSSSSASSSSTSAPGGEAAAAGDAAHGKQLFASNCASCHGASGTEGGVGPSLKDEKTRKDATATIAWIKDPQPPIPKLFPGTLSEKDVADLAAFVQTL